MSDKTSIRDHELYAISLTFSGFFAGLVAFLFALLTADFTSFELGKKAGFRLGWQEAHRNEETRSATINAVACYRMVARGDEPDREACNEALNHLQIVWFNPPTLDN